MGRAFSAPCFPVGRSPQPQPSPHHPAWCRGLPSSPTPLSGSQAFHDCFLSGLKSSCCPISPNPGHALPLWQQHPRVITSLLDCPTLSPAHPLRLCSCLPLPQNTLSYLSKPITSFRDSSSVSSSTKPSLTAHFIKTFLLGTEIFKYRRDCPPSPAQAANPQTCELHTRLLFQATTSWGGF